MLKNLVNAHIDLLGEDRAGKLLEKVQVSSAIASEETLQGLLPELLRLNNLAEKPDPTEAALPSMPEIVELKKLAPAIYWILTTACEHSAKKRKKDIRRSKLKSDLEERIRNAVSIKGVYKAFDHATNLANPLYSYTSSDGRVRARLSIDANSHKRLLTADVVVPKKPLYLLEYCNEDFRKVLFAACRYHGIDEDQLKDLEALVDLLVGLGFPDADQNDYVSSFVTLITGSFYSGTERNPRKYRHDRRERK